MKRNSIIQRITAAALISILAVSMAGCGAKKTVDSGTGEAKENNTNAAENKDVPKGRYVENTIPMPFGEGEYVLDLIRTQDGGFEMYTRIDEKESSINKAYQYDGSAWSEKEQYTAQGLPEGSTIFYSAYGKDGTLYVIYADREYKAHLVKLASGSPMEELSVGIEDQMVSVNGLYVKDDGTVIIPVRDQVLIVDASGTVKDKLPQKYSFSNFCDSHALTANSFLTVGDQGFLRYNKDSWKEEESIPFQNDEMDLYGSLDAGTGDDFYLANTKGIHHMAAQGTMWETIVDGSLNSMGMPSASIKRLFVGNDNDFYLWYVENEVSKMAHYTYDPEMPSVPSKTITVYGLDLTDNQSIRQAASLYQMENPDTRVEVIDGTNESGSTSKTDTIRSLNAELLNGAGADVLVLDGLPTDSYIEKGILEDLSDIITPMVESGELYSNIAESFTGEDGSIYQYPVRVILPVIYGNGAAIGGTASLEAVREWQEKNPDQAMFPKTIYENILRQLIYLYYPELKSGEAGRLDTEKIQFLLETAKTMGDASGCQTVFDESEDGGRGGVYNAFGVKGFTGLGDYSLLKGDSAASIEQFKGMQDVMLPYAMTEKYGYQLRQFNDIYYPTGLLGVTKFSKEKETARKFVEFALSLKVQEGDLSDGFTVSKKAAEVWLERTLNLSVAVSIGEMDDALSAEYPDEQKKSEVMGMIGKLHTPITVDDVLLEMIVSETKGYFEGTQTAVSAAEQFENKAKLYYAE